MNQHILRKNAPFALPSRFIKNTKATKPLSLKKKILIQLLVSGLFLLLFWGFLKLPGYSSTNLKGYINKTFDIKTIFYQINSRISLITTPKILNSDVSTLNTSQLGNKYWALDYSSFYEPDVVTESTEIKLDTSQEIMLDTPQETVDELPVIPDSKETVAEKIKLNFLNPVKGALSASYGYRIHPITKKKEFHKGLDIAANNGTLIKAVSNGTIIEAGYDSTYGNYIKIKHSDTFSTLYAHCSRLLTKKGTKVTKGQTIALVGSTGTSIGPHLHFEVIKNGDKINPAQYVSY